jgi:hypothetical protein
MENTYDALRRDMSHISSTVYLASSSTTALTELMYFSEVAEIGLPVLGSYLTLILTTPSCQLYDT